MAVKGATVKTDLRKSYVPVPADVFTPDQPLDFSLYARPDGGAIKQVCGRGEAIEAKVLRSLRKAKARVLYVDTAEHRSYQKFAESMLRQMIERDDLDTSRKADICYSTTRDLVREAFESNNLEQAIETHRKTWVNNMVALICDDEAAIDTMLSMLSHDYYTYTHMVNISVMVAALAYQLGERDEGRLKQLSSGGLLHDIGKTQVNPDTLNKVGRLTNEEWEELKSHPGLGLKCLHNREGITSTELMMVHQHHEKLDGSGYPQGVLGTEILLEAQMTAVVDIYDALTCKRPYRKAMEHAEAVSILREESAQKINHELVKVWIETAERARSTGE